MKAYRNREGYKDMTAGTAIETEGKESRMADEMLSLFIESGLDKGVYRTFIDLACKGKISKYTFHLFMARSRKYMEGSKKAMQITGRA